MACPINVDNKFDCANQVQGGITARLLLYNWQDWQAGTITEGVDGRITDYTNAVDIKAFDYSVADSGNVIPSVALRAVDGGADGFDHQVISAGFDISEVGKAEIDKMRFQKIVAIIERVNGTAEVYGRNVGLRLSDYQYSPGSSDLGGVIQFTLKTPDNDPPEIKGATTIDAGSPASTVALLDGLTTVGVV